MATLPLRILESLIDRIRWPACSLGAAVFLPMMLVFLFTGAYFPTPETSPWDDPLEVTGVFMLITAMPAYTLMCFVASHRSLIAFRQVLSEKLDDSGREILERQSGSGYWLVAAILGAANALYFNIYWEALDLESSAPAFANSVAIIFGQVVMWVVVSIVLFFRLQASWMLHQVASRVRVDLYDLNSLNGFGREGLGNLLMVAGALALTTLQSISGNWNFGNYFNALVVGLPAGLVLVVLPIYRIHRKIVAEKKCRLTALDSEIARSSKSLEQSQLVRLNALMQHREQLQGLRNWPMDLSLFSRLVFYVFIPPLAWTGAALVEMYLDSTLQ